MRNQPTRILLFVLFCLLMNVSCEENQPRASRAQPEPPQKTIVAMGDSLTEGLGVAEESAYPALVEKKLRAAGFACQVVNAGVSGETSAGALSRIGWVMSLEPEIVILETGANDGFRGIDPDLIRKNISAMVKYLKERGVGVILVGMKMVSNMGERYTTRFAEIYPAVSAKESIPLVPFMLEGVAGRPELNQPDGIHPTAAGYRVVADTLYPYVVDALVTRQKR